MAQSKAADTAGENGTQDELTSRHFWTLVVGSIGVVYGDIGTSPLYALREAVVAARHGGIDDREAVLGVLSLIVWALVLIVTIKYVTLLLRADNRGEGGMFALMALGQSVARRSSPLIFGLGDRGRIVLLRRRGHHAGDLGPLRGRGVEARLARVREVGLAALDRHSRRSLCRAVARHRQGRSVLRPDHRRLVSRARGRRARAPRRRSERARRHEPALWHSIHRQQWPHRPHGHGSRLPGRDRCRSALCRPRPFRAQADPVRLVLSGFSGSACSTTSARARSCSPTPKR